MEVGVEEWVTGVWDSRSRGSGPKQIRVHMGEGQEARPESGQQNVRLKNLSGEVHGSNHKM